VETCNAVLSLGEFFFRHRSFATATVTSLAIFIPLGISWRQERERERDALLMEFGSWSRRLQRLIDGSILSPQDDDRPRRLITSWNPDFIHLGTEAVAASRILALVQSLYPSGASNPAPTTFAALAGQEIPIASTDAPLYSHAEEMLVAWAKIRHASSTGCSYSDPISDAARGFQKGRESFSLAGTYGMAVSYRCAFEYRLEAPQATDLALCADALSCARQALDAVVALEVVRRSGAAVDCDDFELRGRTLRLDVLAQLALHHARLPTPNWLSEARSPEQLLSQLDNARSRLLECDNPGRRRDSSLFRTLAETDAAMFALRQYDKAPEVTLASEAIGLARSAARWLLTAKNLASPRVWSSWQTGSFCTFQANSIAADAFEAVLGENPVRSCP
jgi:hypothetical protein